MLTRKASIACVANLASIFSLFSLSLSLYIHTLAQTTSFGLFDHQLPHQDTPFLGFPPYPLHPLSLPLQRSPTCSTRLSTHPCTIGHPSIDQAGTALIHADRTFIHQTARASFRQSYLKILFVAHRCSSIVTLLFPAPHPFVTKATRNKSHGTRATDQPC